MISFASWARVTACLVATSAVGGVRSFGWDPVLQMEHIVIGTIIGFEGPEVILNVEEPLKGPLSKGQLRATWMGLMPCDTCSPSKTHEGLTPGARVITMLATQRPGGALSAYEENTSPFTDERRTQIVNTLAAAAAKKRKIAR